MSVKGSVGGVSPFVNLSAMSGFTLGPTAQQQQTGDALAAQTQRPVAKPRRSKPQQQQNGQVAAEAMDVSSQSQAVSSTSQPSFPSSSLLSQVMEAEDEDVAERSFSQLSGSAQEQMLQVISAAIRNYAATNDSRYLMSPHRQIIGGQDDHGDT